MIKFSKTLILGSIATLGLGIGLSVKVSSQTSDETQALKINDKQNYDFEAFLENKSSQEKEMIQNNFYNSLEQKDNDIKVNMDKINKNLFDKTILNIFETTLIKDVNLQVLLNFVDNSKKSMETLTDHNNDKFRLAADVAWYTWITGYWYLNFNNYASEWIYYNGSNSGELTGVLADALSGVPYVGTAAQALSLALSAVSKIFEDNNQGNGVYIGMEFAVPLIGWGPSGHNWN